MTSVTPEVRVTEVARIAGVSRPTVYAWMAETSEPSASEAQILQRELGIPVESWRKNGSAA